MECTSGMLQSFLFTWGNKPYPSILIHLIRITYCRLGVIGIFHSALPLSLQCKQFYGNAQHDISRAARFVSYQNVIYTCNNSLTHIKEVQYHSMGVTKKISNERSCALIQKGLGSNRLIGSLDKLC